MRKIFQTGIMIFCTEYSARCFRLDIVRHLEYNGSGVAYHTGETLQELGLPAGTSTVLAMLVGGAVTYSAEKYFFKDAAGNVVGEYTGEELDRILKGKLGHSPDIPSVKGSVADDLLEGGSGVIDDELNKIIDQLYRPGATVGDGGTAAKLVEEFNNGESTHLLKATQRLKQLKGLQSPGELRLNDLDVVEALIDDLEYAISLFD